MNISHIEHLGIAVKSLEEAIPYYENILGLKCYSIEGRPKSNYWSRQARTALLPNL